MSLTLIRCFVAIELPGDIQAVLASIQMEFKKAGVKGLRWVEPKGVHLTLKFLGDTYSEQVEGIQQAIAMVTCNQTSFTLKLSQTGFFPNERNPRVLWIGLGGDVNRLGVLQAEIDNTVTRFGFPKEHRRFEAHLTLARVRDEASANDLKKLVSIVSQPHDYSGVEFRVKAVSLMQSELLPGGARYRCLFASPIV
jgi:2'-5' RNA ligase